MRQRNHPYTHRKKVYLFPGSESDWKAADYGRKKVWKKHLAVYVKMS